MSAGALARSIGFAVVLGGWFGTPARAADVVVAVGASTPLHVSVGRAVCRQLQKAGKLSCEVLSTEAGDATESMAVLANVRDVTIEMGLVASDWQHHAYAGTGPFEYIDLPFDNLRSLFSLHAEPFTLIARNDAGVSSLEDLEGKRVNIGSPGSSERVMMETVMQVMGWTRDSFQLADELTVAEQTLALCHDRVQAIVATGVHPDADIARALVLCDARVVEVSGAAIDRLVEANRFFSIIEIPATAYAGMERGVKTFGVRLTAISAEDIDEGTVHEVVESVFDNLDAIKRLHAALGKLRPQSMVTDGLSAPLHPGASKYFRAHGLM